MSSGGQQPAQTTATSTPWSGAQPALQALYNSTQGQYQSDVGYQPYTGNLQAPLDPQLQSALGFETQMLGQDLSGSPGVNAARNLGTTMQGSQGLTPQLQQAAGQYQDIYNQASGQQNPFLQNILDTSNRRIGDRINAAMSGAGRYGSGAHTDVMARALAESADPILAQDYAQRQALRMQATGAGADIYGQGLQRAGQWAQLMPSLDEARYAPVERWENIGKFYQDRSAQDLANQVAVYNAQQARPWEQLARYANIVSGAGGLGGTKVTTQNPYQPSTLARVGGGALAGAGLGSMFGPMGAGVGAAGGGLLGLL